MTFFKKAEYFFSKKNAWKTLSNGQKTQQDVYKKKPNKIQMVGGRDC